MIETTPFRDIIDSIVNHFQLPPWAQSDGSILTPGTWVEAVAYHESTGNPTARHYDPTASKLFGNGMDDGPYEDWASYGLFQIEGDTYRRLYRLPKNVSYNFESQLFLPVHNIETGIRDLIETLGRYNGDVSRTLADYNGGPHGAEQRPEGNLVDQIYVEFVRSAAKKVAADRRS